MIAAATHLSTKESFQQQAQPDHSQIIIDAFIESCKAFDASVFEPYIEEDNVFEDKNKFALNSTPTRSK